MFHDVGTARSFGVVVDGAARIDLKALIKRSRDVAGELNAGVGFLLKKNGVDVIWGEARLEPGGGMLVAAAKEGASHPAPPKGALGPGRYAARHTIIATGARPRTLPSIEPDGCRIWTYFEAMVPPELPKSLLIIGSGAIGIEFASFYRALGSEVTVVELLPRILPAEDAEIAALARRAFEKVGVKILTDARVASAERGATGVTALVELAGSRRETIAAERLISAVGVVGNIEGLGLEALGVTTAGGLIVADPLGRTSVAGIYAIGDVAGPPMLAHKAEHEGVICVEAIKGLPVHGLDKLRIPACTYSRPQVASVGLTEEQARAEVGAIRVGRFPFRANGKALALGEREGLVKTIFAAETGELVGAHMIGAEVTELIQGFVVAMQLEATEEDLLRTVFPHPTLSEMMGESALAAYGRPIHIPPAGRASTSA
jgi:dihydrolipoamide dehydrogenase